VNPGGLESLRFNMMTFAVPKQPPKIPAYTNELATKAQKFGKRTGFLLTNRKLQIIYEAKQQYRRTT
jgi:hypothetical protein